MECVELLRWALPRLRFRWRGYRRIRRQVCRRIRERAAELGAGGMQGYRARLEADPGEWEVLRALCRITISRFRRDRDVWDFLAGRVLPVLAEAACRELEPAARAAAAGGTDAPPPPSPVVLRAWSAGCASGEEPYSLALLWDLDLAPALPGCELRITATDKHAEALARAHRAVYGEGSLREIPPHWRAAFAPHPEGRLLPEARRRRIRFREHDLERESPPGTFHLVLARNSAFTYFAPDLQLEVLARLRAALLPGGVLVVGEREELPAEGAADFERLRRSVYRRQ